MNSNTRLVTTLRLCVSGSVFLFVALALIVPSGYSLGALLLLLPALVYLFVRPYPSLIAADKYLIAALLGYFVVGAVSNYLHHLSHSSFDKLSRFLLVIPVLLLLLRFPVKPLFMYAGIAVGAIGAGVLSAWNVWGQGALRAAGHTNAIQFGDIALLFSCMLLPLVILAKHHSKWLLVLFSVGIIGGIVASVLSGARGGWLALPATLLMLYIALGFYKQIKMTMIYLFIFICPIVLFNLLPHSHLVQSRIDAGLLDIQRYQTANDITSSLGSRLHLWQLSVKMIAQQPLVGWGTLEAVSHYLDAQGAHDEVVAHYNHVHNEFLDALLRHGVLGGFALLMIFVVPAGLFYRQFRRAPPLQTDTPLVGLVLILCTVIFGLTQTFFSHTSGVMIYVFTLVMLWSQTRVSVASDYSD